MIRSKLMKTSIATRIWIILLLFAVALFTSVIFDAKKTQQLMRKNYERGVVNLVESAKGIAHHYYQLSADGKLSVEQAKKEALAAISAMRFDGGNYIFVIDKDGVEIAIPIKSLLGKNVLGLKDSEGKLFVVDLFKTAKSGGGFVDYTWKQPNSDEVKPKTSYVLQHNEWGWVIGSGMNMAALTSDVQSAKSSSYQQAFITCIILAVIMVFFIRSITSPLKRTVSAMRNLSKGEGDLTQRLPEEGSPELADLSRSFNQFVASIQNIMKCIKDLGNQVSTSTVQVTDSIRNIDNSLGQQKSDVEELATSMTGMMTTVEEVTARTVEANEASSMATNEAKGSQVIIRKNVNEAATLAEEIHSASEVVTKLSEDAKNVDTVLEVIRGVAEQTNLLALNAAIESARAGEHGRGFAVVADEVRTLSVRSQDSTIEIQNIIEKLQQDAEIVATKMTQGAEKASDASTLSNQAGDALNKIDVEVKKIKQMNRYIAQASENQTLTVKDVNHNVESLRQMSATVSSESSQMARSSEELTNISEKLVKMISRFKLA
ncbi:methyl-accepting chemotaxis protein [Vibrio marisflavi]|uniref:Methyl-accepting chemotaxis protein McpP n=1 Tax=Vibrio marisflavi CECT 7928 TaxID=634439 RepID=A0ABM9A570_9VIBR|nr:methyl-accepting chemotaxis protein [Vibrio marisflavi]CAH0540271.1 Methyl-accepting chemotaxis protein McpP [Vibrio marisflavi CECT 7928]